METTTMDSTVTWEPFKELYLALGLKYKDIKSVLRNDHRFHVSQRQIMGFSRRKAYSHLADMVNFIINQLQSTGQLHGYRWIYAKCRHYGLRVKKEDVRLVLKEVYPRIVSLRQARRLRRRKYFSKGPNFIWHLCSYDKLKPYGICVHGCTDGFSNKIIWLNAYNTNSDPKLIGGYFIESVQRLGGCPRVVRGDLGTENGYVRDFQRFLLPTQSDDSYLGGASSANQRTEYCWGFLRRQCLQVWLALFGDIREKGFFDGGHLDKSLLQFCCLGLIQGELDETAQVWNAHHIRPSKDLNTPRGRPNVMYLLPGLYRTGDFLFRVENEHVQLCKSECVFRLSIPCDPDVYELCNIIMAESHLSQPNDPYQAVNLYMCLREAFSAFL